MCNKDKIYKMIAVNMRTERKRLGISQIQLAEKADLSIDTIKSVENARRAMSLDTYLRIVQALESTPLSLIHGSDCENYMDRFIFMTVERSSKEVEFALHMVEQMLLGQDSYLNG
ncbi:MAG: XRE family transcriptional regulator [Clostridia bacterium]|nr:XRE family transcriptional regulator [Clostridia bacterium]